MLHKLSPTWRRGALFLRGECLAHNIGQNAKSHSLSLAPHKTQRATQPGQMSLDTDATLEPHCFTETQLCTQGEKIERNTIGSRRTTERRTDGTAVASQSRALGQKSGEVQHFRCEWHFLHALHYFAWFQHRTFDSCIFLLISRNNQDQLQKIPNTRNMLSFELTHHDPLRNLERQTAAPPNKLLLELKSRTIMVQTFFSCQVKYI